MAAAPPTGSQTSTSGFNLPYYGQGNASVTGGSGTGDLGGSSYQGDLGNFVSNIPIVGGLASSLLTSLYGSKPAVSSPITTANQAIRGNAQNLPANQALTLGSDALTAEGSELPFQMNLPNYQGMLQSATGNVSAELNGQVPQDVQNLIAQSAAERGIQTGQGPNSPNTNAAYLQALGLTSEQQTQTGQAGLTSLIGETPTGAAINPAQMFVTPEDQQSAQQYANTIAAAPDPQAAGLLNTFESFL